jgi:hypothetical protein
MEKQFKLRADQIVDLTQMSAGCIATDKITVNGEPVDYMYREESGFQYDSGWRFFSGTEDQAYVEDAQNSMIYKVNTIANYDPSIIPYLEYPQGTRLERVRGTDTFQIIAD